MTIKPQNPPAFPTDINANFDRQGMSLRDYFAGQALAGLWANPSYTETTEDQVAQAAYDQADAMLKVRGELI